MRLRVQIVKELLSFLRDPKSRAALLGPPLMQLVIFSTAMTLEVRHAPVALLNDDAGRTSRELVRRIEASSFVDEVVLVDSPEAMREALDEREVLVGLHVPADFSRRIARGEPATVQALGDGRRANGAQIAVHYLSAIAKGLNADLGLELAPGRAPERVTTVVRHWFNPNLEYQWFVVPGLAAILVMFSSLIVTALSIARERELGTFDQLLVSPATPLEIILGKVLPALFVGSALGGVMICAALFVFGVPFTGHLLPLLGSLVVFILAMAGVGLTISSICNTQQQAILGAFAVGVTLVLLSGFATPVENMPHVLQLVAQASPLKHFLVVIEGSFLKGFPVREVAANTWPILVIATGSLLVAVLAVRRKLG